MTGSAVIYVHPQYAQCSAEFRARKDGTTLNLHVEGMTVAILGDASHAEALEKMAALFNGAFASQTPPVDDADYLEPVAAELEAAAPDFYPF